MKVLHCAESYAPVTSGVGKVVQKYAEYFSQRGVESWVATGNNGDWKEYEVINNVNVKRFNLKGNDVKRIKGNQEEFLKFLNAQKFDVIVTYAAQTWHFDILKRINKKEIGNALLVAFPCGFSGLVSFRRPFYYKYFKDLPKYLSNFDSVILHSANYIDYQFIEENFSGDTMVLPNGVDTKEFSFDESIIDIDDVLKNNGIDINKKIILNVGNHMYAKNHKAFIGLASAFPNLEFINVGRDQDSVGSCYKYCKKKAEKLENFHTLELSRNELIALYKKSWLFLLTSNVEVFPLVLLESLMSSTPFISFDVGNAKELIGGYVVRSISDMKSKIEEISHDDNLYSQLLSEARDSTANSYSWEIVLKDYFMKINNLLNERETNTKEKTYATN